MLKQEEKDEWFSIPEKKQQELAMILGDLLDDLNQLDKNNFNEGLELAFNHG